MTTQSEESSPVLRALREKGIPHRLFRHAGSVESLEQAAAERGQAPDQVVRSILFRLGGGAYALALIAGARRLDWVKIRRALGRSRLTMAAPQEVLAVTGCAVGTVGPFGLPPEVPVLLDESVLQQVELSCGSGVPGLGIIIRREDFLAALPEARRGVFEENK